MRLHLASGNLHKAAELATLALASSESLHTRPIEIISARAVGGMPHVDEDTGTFVGNARQKAQALRAVLGGCLVHISIEFLATPYYPLVPYWVPLSWWGTGFETIASSAIALLLGIAVGWTIVRLYQGRRAILFCYLLLMQVLGALMMTAISGTSLAFYVMTSVNLSIGILIGGLWIGRPVQATGTAEGDIP